MWFSGAARDAKRFPQPPPNSRQMRAASLPSKPVLGATPHTVLPGLQHPPRHPLGVPVEAPWARRVRGTPAGDTSPPIPLCCATQIPSPPATASATVPERVQHLFIILRLLQPLEHSLFSHSEGNKSNEKNDCAICSSSVSPALPRQFIPVTLAVSVPWAAAGEAQRSGCLSHPKWAFPSVRSSARGLQLEKETPRCIPLLGETEQGGREVALEMRGILARNCFMVWSQAETSRGAGHPKSHASRSTWCH